MTRCLSMGDPRVPERGGIMKILITGSNGYIGRNLSWLIRENFGRVNLFGLDISRQPAPGNQETFIADIADEKKLIKILISVKPDYIFHLAGVINTRDWDELYQGNVQKTGKFLEAVRKAGIPAKVIIPGSAAEYGKVTKADLPVTEECPPCPLTLYGLSKLFQTGMVRYYAALGVNVVIGRVFNFIGEGIPEYMSVGTFLGQVKKIKAGRSKNEIMVGNIKSKRDFLDIHDVCAGLVAVAEKGRNGEIYNICSGASVSMESILKMMIRESGVKARIKVDKKRLKTGDIPDIYGSNRKIRKETGWHPSIPLESIIKRCLNGR